MSFAKDPASYPAAFTVLLTHFASPEAQPVTQHFARAADAVKLRFTFYNYKKALALSGDKGGLRLANGIVVKLISHPHAPGASLEFSLRDNEGFALGLEEAIRQAQGQGGAQLAQCAERQPVTAQSQGQGAASPSSDDMVSRYMQG